MLFEALAAKNTGIDDSQVTRLCLSQVEGVYKADWEPLIPVLINESLPRAERAAHFHLSMAHTILDQAIHIREDTGVNSVGLAGGVFQNRVLTEKCILLLNKAGFEVILPLLMPVNDASISFGQIVEHGYHRRK